jgi:hypothetical protein
MKFEQKLLLRQLRQNFIDHLHLLKQTILNHLHLSKQKQRKFASFGAEIQNFSYKMKNFNLRLKY